MVSATFLYEFLLDNRIKQQSPTVYIFTVCMPLMRFLSMCLANYIILRFCRTRMCVLEYTCCSREFASNFEKQTRNTSLDLVPSHEYSIVSREWEQIVPMQLKNNQAQPKQQKQRANAHERLLKKHRGLRAAMHPHMPCGWVRHERAWQ